MKIELLHVPGCANLEGTRELLHSTLSELRLDDPVEEKEGAFPSPTILVDGIDVMGRPDAAGASCRLDLPTRDRLIGVLRSASVANT